MSKENKIALLVSEIEKELKTLNDQRADLVAQVKAIDKERDNYVKVLGKFVKRNSAKTTVSEQQPAPKRTGKETRGRKQKNNDEEYLAAVGGSWKSIGEIKKALKVSSHGLVSKRLYALEKGKKLESKKEGTKVLFKKT